MAANVVKAGRQMKAALRTGQLVRKRYRSTAQTVVGSAIQVVLVWEEHAQFSLMVQPARAAVKGNGDWEVGEAYLPTTTNLVGKEK